MLPHDGFLASFPRFDVPTFFGREIGKCKEFAAAWYGKDLPSLGSTDTVGIIQERYNEEIDGYCRSRFPSSMLLIT
jgi:hypothetical protein